MGAEEYDHLQGAFAVHQIHDAFHRIPNTCSMCLILFFSQADGRGNLNRFWCYTGQHCIGVVGWTKKAQHPSASDRSAGRAQPFDRTYKLCSEYPTRGRRRCSAEARVSKREKSTWGKRQMRTRRRTSEGHLKRQERRLAQAICIIFVIIKMKRNVPSGPP